MLLIYLLLIIILLSLIYIIYHSRPSRSADLSKEINTLINLANEKLSDKGNQIQTDLSNKKDAIEKMVKRVLDELTKNQLKLETAERERVGSFNGLRAAIENSQQLTQQLKVTADSLKSVLSNNQLRGAFGEQVAEDLLKASGFVAGVNYYKQKTAGTSRPDYTVILPDGTKINIDVKFPYQNLVKMSETDDRHQKDQFLKAFTADISQKIKEVSSRDYINPQDQTVDFVILFIPNEMIFSFIYERLPDARQEALIKKVILAGPFSFTAILRLIYQTYENFRFQKDIQSVINQIKHFEKQFAQYNLSFQELGKKIDAVLRHYQSLETTRTNQLLRSIDKLSLPSSQLPS